MTKPRVDVLIEGFADETNLSRGRARYRPTIALIRAQDAIVLVDPGTVEHQQDIRDALARHGIAIDQVSLVIHTHHHLDHTRNTGMFPDVPVIDGWAAWSGVDYNIAGLTLTEGIHIEKSPGHTYDSLTIYVDTAEGLVAICGDVMWWEGDTTSNVYAQDIDALMWSRATLLAKADAIIPGHGPLFRVRH